MKILCIGDVVGSAGCEFLRQKLPTLKKERGISAVIANGENSADGNGITPTSAKHIFASGVDLITTGNHVFKRPEFAEYLEENEFITRPANYPSSVVGSGMGFIDLGHTQIAVINLLGVVDLEPLESPFDVADRLVEEARQKGSKIIIVDFHAEATAEKAALAFYLDGRVSALFGTHTHVQTADARVLEKGMGFITDVGMTGPYNSVIGIKPELAIKKMKEHTPVRFQYADTPCSMQGVIFTFDKQSGKCVAAENINIF